MKAIVEMSYEVRGRKTSSYASYPKIFDLEKDLCNKLDFLKRQGGPFTLTLRLEDAGKTS